MLNLFTLNFIGSPVHLDFMDLLGFPNIFDLLILLDIPDYPKIVAPVDGNFPKSLTCGFE